jgi:hypothetical protein
VPVILGVVLTGWLAARRELRQAPPYVLGIAVGTYVWSLFRLWL